MPRKPANPYSRKTYTGKTIPAFCINVQKKRLELGMSQAELAEKIDTARPRISELESGRFPEDPERIVAIAKALSVDINWLFGFNPSDQGQ